MTVSTHNKADNFQYLQDVFTQHMRDPKNNAVPEGIEGRRLKIYSELVYNNIEGFIANSFPVLRKVIKDDQWHQMLRDYVCNHQAHTPLFPKMPQEFIQYLEHERSGHPEDYPFLLELAHYEWIEISVSMDSREISFDDIDQEGDLLEGIPQLNPLAVPLAYEWPAHKISPEFIPEEKPEQATYLLVYRDRDFEMGFMELNPVSAKLIEALTNNVNQSGRDILNSITKQLNHPEPETVIKGGLEIMLYLKQKDVLPGIKKL